MQTKAILWLLVPLLTLTTVTAQGQTRRQPTTRTEKVARAKWQPVRQTAQVEVIEEGSIVELNSPPMEGEVYLDPLPVHGELACDAIGPAGSCDGIACGQPSCESCCRETPSWRPCLTLCLPQDGWVSFEYLMWWQKGMALPPLVSQDIAGDGTDFGGALGPGSEILYGNQQVLEDSLNGGRLRLGLWLDGCHEWAVQAEFFSTNTITDSFALSSNGNPSTGRPFLDVDGMLERSLLIGSQTPQGDVVDTGNIQIGVESQLEGTGVHFRRKLLTHKGCGDTIFARLPQQYRSQFSGLIGWRWLELDESILIDGTTNSIRTPQDPTTFRVRDQFETRAQFNGIDIGTVYSRQRGCWDLDLQTRLALGISRQTVRIDGSTSFNGDDEVSGGLLALPSNIGIYERDRFAVVPELNAKLGYQLTPQLKATIGYSFIYWSNVVRPGDQISRIVDETQVPSSNGDSTTARFPEFAFNETDYWVQGISFGGEYQW